MKDANQRFALSVVGPDGTPKYDSRYVRIMAIYHLKNNDGSQTFIDMPLHDCTEEDFEHFYEPDSETEVIIKSWEGIINFKMFESFKCMNTDAYEEMFMKANKI